MNGYLNNLAARTMNAGNLVEPRLPSLFEPQRVVESAVESSADVPARVPGDVPASVPASVPAHSNPHPAGAHAAVVENSIAANEIVNTDNSIATSFEDAPIKISVEQAPANVPVDAEAPNKEAPEEASAPKVPETISGEVPVVMVETVSKQSPAPALKSAKAPPLRELPFESIQSVQAAKSVEHDSAATVTVRPRFEREEEERHQASSEIEERISFKTEVVPQVIERVVERSRNTERTDFKTITRSVTNHAWRKSIAAEQETSINVTIGRVEVRAMPATNPKPRISRAESPVMPLEEYLRKLRPGGER
jgi:hypothetical protein